ncbi:GDYXXLXY domain-containing protein [Rhodoferax aquaticus]|uniref:DUF4401 domain-containing protein n=1 Tax=Rhodoferax aquaticus TaxID=2527691 RepID=A0A515ES33_9BURK|nr:GDYXXLXY domain-containing protein [Rhodoferax aquaticus]QDL55476.1 DUF4401 domain-containing protein [Rhodoferax aquaticus]
MNTAAHTSLQKAIDAGVLPAHATLDDTHSRPWPVVLLTALGAWFAAIPLLIAVGLLLGDVLLRGASPYVVGALVLAAAVVVMRATELPIFVEQLAVPALWVGAGCLGFGAYRDLSDVLAPGLLLLITLGVAWAIDKAWLRVILGATAASLLATVLLKSWHWEQRHTAALLVLHGLLALWLLALWLQERQPRAAAWIEAMGTGWLLTTLVGLCALAGKTFLLGAALGSNEVGEVVGWLMDDERGSWQANAMQLGGCTLVLAGACVGALAWPSLRKPLPLLVVGVVAVLAWFMPVLGAVMLALMVTASTQRWRLAAACGVAACWVLGGFYYQLQWPLAHKALLLAAMGAGLGVATWWAQAPSAIQTPAQHAEPLWRTPQALSLLAGGLLTVLVANGAIWQKEGLIANGTRMYVALQPVDPRSLMQGDYMQLRFVSLDSTQLPVLDNMTGHRPTLLATLDARGVATLKGVHTSTVPLQPNEQLVQLTPKDGQWVLVTDAWFFKEGQAARWQAAKFGEFRVLPDGRALLVGLADGLLRPIHADMP